MLLSPMINVVNVQDFAPVIGGVPQIGNGLTDDTAAIQAAVDSFEGYLINEGSETADVVVYSSPVLYFPPGKYTVSGKITFNDYHSAIRIVGENAIILASGTFNDYAFYHSRCYDVKMEGLNFINFKKALYMGNSFPEDTGDNRRESAQLRIENCCFQKCGEALRIYAMQAVSFIEKCKFYANKVAVYIEGADQLVMRDNWITAPALDNTSNHPAQIINKGVLIFDSNLLVPLPQTTNPVEPAWINNYADVTALNVRQGAEEDSFTLINNFAGVDDLSDGTENNKEARSVTVKNSQCHGIYGNIYSGSEIVYLHPTIVRYVDAIPNVTCIENNRGMILSKIMGFSKEKYNDDTVAIQNAILASGPAGSITPTNVSVKVENNVGALTHANGSHVPTELWGFVRDDNFLWPAKRSNGLTMIDSQVSTVGSTDDTIEFTFDYGPFNNVYNTFTKTYLVEYTGNPNISSSVYTGSFIGILRANGSWTGIGTNTRQTLILEPVLNQIGDPAPGAYPTGQFAVTAFWEASGNAYLDNTDPNHNFCLKFTGRSGPDNVGYDTIKVTALNVL